MCRTWDWAYKRSFATFHKRVGLCVPVVVGRTCRDPGFNRTCMLNTVQVDLELTWRNNLRRRER